MEYMEEDDQKIEDWKVNVRSDLWNTMNMSQLSIQQEIVLNKLSLLSTMHQSLTVVSIQSALALALGDLNKLLNNNQDIQKQQKRIVL